MQDFLIVEYSPEYALELVQMWRGSFERAVGIVDPHPLEEQLRALKEKVVPQNRVRVVLERDTSAVIGFIASTSTMISLLYVHVDHQGKGIGSMLLNLAKQESGGSLRLFTFKSNIKAQQFYERQGFKIIGRGFEEMWQLEDVEYEWSRVNLSDGSVAS
jgi:ribosomal protein S18 acetylase RimI-like enzyme